MDPPDPPLRDAVVALRPWRDEDVAAKFRGFSDRETQRNSWPERRPYTQQDAWATHRAHQQAWEDGTGAEFACVAPGDDRDITGGASIYDIERAWARASVGYWVAPQARGRGVATHAVLLLARWAFGELGIKRLQLTCGPDNQRRSASPNEPGSRARPCSGPTSRSRAAGATRSCTACCPANWKPALSDLPASRARGHRCAWVGRGAGSPARRRVWCA